MPQRLATELKSGDMVSTPDGWKFLHTVVVSAKGTKVSLTSMNPYTCWEVLKKDLITVSPPLPRF